MVDLFYNQYALGEQTNINDFMSFLKNDFCNPYTDFSFERNKRNLNHYIEAQVHGDISLKNHVDILVADPGFKDTEIGEIFNELCTENDIKLFWHNGYAMSLGEVPRKFRGPIMPEIAKQVSSKGYLSTEMIGIAAQALKQNPDDWSKFGEFPEVLQQLKYLWHVLVTFGKPLNNFV